MKKEKPDYFEWLMFDEESVMPFVITIGVHLMAIVNSALFYVMLVNNFDIIVIFLFGFLAFVSCLKLFQFYWFRQWRALRGLSINKTVWSGKFDGNSKMSNEKARGK